MSGLHDSPSFEERPWGTFTVLDEGAEYKVKRIDVLPELCRYRDGGRAPHDHPVFVPHHVTLIAEASPRQDIDPFDFVFRALIQDGESTPRALLERRRVV